MIDGQQIVDYENNCEMCGVKERMVDVRYCESCFNTVVKQ